MRKQVDLVFQLASLATLILALAALGALVYDIVSDGASRLSWPFLVNIASRNAAEAGVYHALMGSIWVIALTELLALPIGVAAAIYLEEYGSRSRTAKFIELNIANLAAVPSIIYGLLGLGLFVRLMGMGQSVMAGATVMAASIAPMAMVTTDRHSSPRATYSLAVRNSSIIHDSPGPPGQMWSDRWGTGPRTMASRRSTRCDLSGQFTVWARGPRPGGA